MNQLPQQTKQTWFEKLEKRWDVKGWKQISLIFIVFGLTGSSSVFVGKKIMFWMGVSADMSPFVYYPIRILTVFVIYQILLVWIGYLFGQFTFFWNFEKKMLARMGIKFDRQK